MLSRWFLPVFWFLLFNILFIAVFRCSELTQQLTQHSRSGLTSGVLSLPAHHGCLPGGNLPGCSYRGVCTAGHQHTCHSCAFISQEPSSVRKAQCTVALPSIVTDAIASSCLFGVGMVPLNGVCTEEVMHNAKHHRALRGIKARACQCKLRSPTRTYRKRKINQ